MTRWRRTIPRRAAWAWALAAALLFGQALGLAHRVWHAPGAVPLEQAKADASGHRAGDADCRLLDALAAADLLPASVATLPPQAPATPPRVAQVPAGEAARTLAPYLARGPPQG